MRFLTCIVFKRCLVLIDSSSHENYDLKTMRQQVEM